MRDGCPFCDYDGPSEIVKRGMVAIYNAAGDPYDYHYFVIEPLNPVTPGHLLVIPHEHESDFRLDPWLLAATMVAASRFAADIAADEIVFDEKPKPGCNLIVSAGAEATQTVEHLHVHVIPRREGDGLRLPWS
jgi:histidine triad (HIT) family protein